MRTQPVMTRPWAASLSLGAVLAITYVGGSPEALAQELPQLPLPDGIDAEDGDFLTLVKEVALYMIRWGLFILVGASLAIGMFVIGMPLLDWYKGRVDSGEVFGKAFGVGVILLIIGAIGAFGLNTFGDGAGG